MRNEHAVARFFGMTSERPAQIYWKSMENGIGDSWRKQTDFKSTPATTVRINNQSASTNDFYLAFSKKIL